MTKDELSEWLSYIDATHGDTSPLRAHIAALEKERDEARTLECMAASARRMAVEQRDEHRLTLRAIANALGEADHGADMRKRVTSLLGELAELRGVQAQAQVDAKFIHDALGWAGVWPSSLPAPSRAVVALLERVKERDEWKARAESVLKQAETFEVERDAALADNAALLAFVTEQTAVECEDVQDDLCGTCGPCLARTLVSRPHPGIALLEEHRKALGEAQKALESQQAECHTLRRAFLHERHRADTAGAQPEHAFNATWAENLLAEERKALMRARNEGLELLAKRLIERRDQMQGRAMADGRRRGLEEAASIARAMKEPEE